MMNERFFELKKDRQDRIINGAMEIFTKYGYRHASTDEMVAAASISKGLLFHYFKSKSGTYEFLYEYGTRYMLLEMREAVRRAGCEYFEMQRLLLKAEKAVLGKYPCLPLFLERADREHAESGIEFPEELDGAAAAERARLLVESRRPPFLSEEDADRITGLLQYARIGLMGDLLLREQEKAKLTAPDRPSSDSSKIPNELLTTQKPQEDLSLPEEYAKRFLDLLQLLRRRIL